MMMYGDNSMEAELDDLGEEFAAQCAATVGPSYGQADVNYDQQFETNNSLNPQMDMNLSQDSMMSQQDQMPYELDQPVDSVPHSQCQSGATYQQEGDDSMDHHYGQVAYEPDSALDNSQQIPQQDMHQQQQMNYAAGDQQLHQSQMQQQQYGQMMYQQDSMIDQRQQHHHINHVQQHQAPVSISHLQTQPQHSEQMLQAHHLQNQQQQQYVHSQPQHMTTVPQQRRNYIVVPSRQPGVIMPVHRSQQVYSHQQDSQPQPVYVQHLPDGRSQQIVYVKRLVGQGQPVQQAQSQPHRVYVQGPNGLVARTTRPLPQQVRLVRTVSSQDPNGGGIIQRHYVERPVVRQVHQADHPLQHHRVVQSHPQQRIRQSALSTPDHISRMVDHGDYVIPSQQRMVTSSAAPTNSYPNVGGEAYTRLHHHPIQRPPQQQQQQQLLSDPHLQEEDQPEPSYFDDHAAISYDQHQKEDSAGSVHNVKPVPSRIPPSTVNADGSIVKYLGPPPGGYALKPPPLPIPKKKKPEPAPPTATEVAQAAAVQRIGTEEGWKQMNTWLKSAEKENKATHMTDLLKQCLQAKVSVDLLLSNDTPKFVRRLTKNHEDNEVKKLAASCVTKWKKEVANPEVPPPVKKEKKPKEEDTMDYEDADELPLKPLASPSTSKDSKKEKRRSVDAPEGEKKEEKKNKAKARVYTAKSRLTGLEDLPDESKPPDAKKRRESPPKEQKKVSSSPQVKTPTKKLSVKKAPTVQLSTGFMNALAVSVEPKKKTVPKKRSIEPKPPVSDPSTTSTVLDGLFADQTKTIEESKRTPTPPAAPVVVEAEEPDMLPASRRRIRFADEVGKELVLVKEFEIEEGERINVNHLTPEEMKHHEMVMERKFKEQSGESVVDEEDDQQASTASPAELPGRPEIKWHLIPLSNLKCTIEHGSQSEAKLIELERQKTAMRAFCDPNFPVQVLGEPDDFDPISARTHRPTIIPLDLISDDEQGSQEQQPAIVEAPAPAEEPKALPSNLQSLLDGLKKKGIVGGAPSVPSVAVPPASTGLSSLASSISLSGLSSAGLSALTNGLPAVRPPMPAYGQIPTYQQHPGGLVMPPPIHHRPPGMPPPLGVLPSSSSASLGGPPPRHSDSSPAMPATPVQRMANNTAGATASGSHQAYGGGHHGNIRQCQFFKTQRGCHYGARCKFAHGDQPPASGSFGGDRGGYYNRGGYGGAPRGGGYGQRGGGMTHGRGGYGGGGDSQYQQQQHRLPPPLDPIRLDISQQNGVRPIPQSPVENPGIQSPPTITSPVSGGGGPSSSMFRETVTTIPVEATSDSPASPT